MAKRGDPGTGGRDNGRNAQVLSGLESGETVVLYPGEQISDGAAVRKHEFGR